MAHLPRQALLLCEHRRHPGGGPRNRSGAGLAQLPKLRSRLGTWLHANTGGGTTTTYTSYANLNAAARFPNQPNGAQNPNSTA